MHESLQRFPHKNKVYFKCQRIKQGPLQGQAVFQSQDAGGHHNLDSAAVSIFVVILVELTNTVFVNSTNITTNIETAMLSTPPPI